jgi:uncharacterized protein YdiU (UPF0061 family)
MDRSIAHAGWRFDNSYARLPDQLFERTTPTPVRAPAVVVLNDALAADLGLDADLLRTAGAGVFAGNEVPPGAEPIAQAYAGHQFGHFTNLGDGRAILLGEQFAPDGRRVDLQLKGSGRTRYSRGGDGRAALGPMLREYAISEGMHALGIPSTRSLAVAATGEAVLRERPLPGAVLTRVAASHVRVGTFQYAAAVGDRDLLAALLDHAVARHDPAAAAADDPAAAFLDAYEPATVFSSIDRQGRYAYANQPAIAHWNLARLAESLLPLLRGGEEAALETARGAIDTFRGRFDRHYLAGARAKLGLVSEEEGDRELVATLLERMHAAQADFTGTFAGLAAVAAAQAAPAGFLADWAAGWLARLARQPGTRADAAARMRGVNPVVIPRNHHVEAALAAAEAGDLAPFAALVAAIRTPFTETAATAPYRAGPPAGCGPYVTFCGT